MRTVVTGGAGFIGSHLTEHLLARGDEVTVLDDLSTGSLDNLADVIDHPRLRRVHGTVLDRHGVESLVHGADRVFHLAAAVGVRRIVDEPLQSLRINLHGTENVLEAARAAGATVLLASTSEIYGKNTSDALGGLRPDPGLAAALQMDLRRSEGARRGPRPCVLARAGVALSIVRLFNTVGPRQTGRYGMVVPNLVGQALRGEPLTVFGDGRQTRCFSYVGDIVPALVALIEHPATRGRAVNLGGATEISIGALARRIVELLDSRSEIVLVPYALAYGEGYEDMRRRVPDNTLAGELVGFTPRTGIDAIIRNVADAMLGDVAMLPTVLPTRLSA